MTFQKKLREFLSGIGKTIIFVWIVSVLAMQTSVYKQELDRQLVISDLESESFEDYVVYYSIMPSITPVPHGADAYFKSDREIVKFPEQGLRLKWRERIECDHKPYDGRDNYEFYQAVQPTEVTYFRTIDRDDASTYESRRGYPATAVGIARPIKYPEHDANCRLVSAMTQAHAFGVMKIFEMISGVVEVRGERAARANNSIP